MIDRSALTLSAQQARSRQTVHCYRVTKRNGDIVRRTDCSQETWYGSELFEPGFDPGNDARQAGLTERNSVARGVEQTGAITFEDLYTGQVGPGTEVVVFRFDRRMPFQAEERRCRVVEATFSTNGEFALEIVTEAIAKLMEKRGELVSRHCRNVFGDQQCASPLTTDGAGGLVIDEWTIGIDTGPWPTVTQVTTSTEFRVAIPRVEIIGATTGTDLGNRDFIEFTTDGPHHLGGITPNPLNTDPLRIRYGIRGQSGGTPDLNGQRDGWTAYATGTDTIRVLETVSVVPPTLGFIGFEPPAGWFDHGALAWKSGPNLGLPTRIRSSTEFVEDASGSFGGYVDIVLSTELMIPPEVGHTLQLVTGCDGKRLTCVGKFDRVAVFRGEPTIGTAEDMASFPANR